ncbi:hypothetical protein J4Q44_G00211780 [Coregonus suidteri]|uniref:Uncharacterized protein n=1 Tax=Coregonus suidteri TaxID=861788 RepID=A0AAN8L987_9TELE
MRTLTQALCTALEETPSEAETLPMEIGCPVASPQASVTLESIEERRQRVVSHPEQLDGVPSKIKYPDGRERIRRFRLSESIQNGPTYRFTYALESEWTRTSAPSPT